MLRAHVCPALGLVRSLHTSLLLAPVFLVAVATESSYVRGLQMSLLLALIWVSLLAVATDADQGRPSSSPCRTVGPPGTAHVRW